jgi:RND family efflux transporter MFP subunit
MHALLKHLPSVLALLCLALPATILFFASNSPSPAGHSSAAPPNAQVRRVAAPRELKIVGEFVPAATSQITTRVAGRVAEIRVKAGDVVSTGAVLAVIRAKEVDDRILRHEAGVRDAQSELQKREWEWAEAVKLLESRHDLARRDLIARREIEDHQAAADGARAAWDLARARVEQQQAMLAQARALRALTVVRASSGGQVVRLMVQPGEPVSENATILTVGNLDQLRLVGEIGAVDASGLQLGALARVKIRTSAGRVFAGEVLRVSERENHTTEVEIAVDNRQRLLESGAAVEAWVTPEKRPDDPFVPARQ